VQHTGARYGELIYIKLTTLEGIVVSVL
jgi:hypothetical protein